MSLLLAYDHYMLGSRVIVVKMPQAAVPEGDMRLLGQALGCSRVCGCISSTSRKRRCALEKCAGGKRATTMAQATSMENLLLRVKDIPAVLDQMATWSKDKRHPLASRI